MRILLSGGPTHEYWDDVRYLGNPSTGAMGIALAEAARDRGHAVTLVLGPTHLADPAGVAVHRVVSALDMLRALEECWDSAEALVMSAAVSDYRPARRHPGKWKKEGARLELPLERNPDILATLGRMGAGRPVVGFALEASPFEDAVLSARSKLENKRCSLVVMNRPASFAGSRGAGVTLVSRDEAVVLGDVTKRQLAERLIAYLEAEARGRSHGEEVTGGTGR